MLVPNRHGSSSAYRYGFQGQEKDDELKGEGNSLNYTFRMHDPRVGRFFAVDPLSPKYPHYSTYSFSGNKVIAHVEIEGLEDMDFKVARWEAQKIQEAALKNGSSHEESKKVYRDAYKKLAPFGNIPDEVAWTVGEVGAGFVPGLGQAIDVKDTHDAFNGGDNWDKTFAIIGWFPAGDIFKGAKKLFKTADNIAGSKKALKSLNNAASKIDNLLLKVESLKNSFKDGKYTIAQATEDITVYRVSGGSSKKGTGDFFSTVKPKSSADAEKKLNINMWGNTGTEVTPVTIKKGTVFATGSVAGGTGTQIYIPKDLQKAEGNNIIRHFSKTEKLE
jgi:RHS repeat-associated protein